MAHRFCLGILMALVAASGVAQVSLLRPGGHAKEPQSSTPGAPITVRYNDVRKAAGITFLQDSTQTDQKYYLETMGTGVAWINGRAVSARASSRNSNRRASSRHR